MEGDADADQLSTSLGTTCVVGSTVAALVANLAEENTQTRSRVDALAADLAAIRSLLEAQPVEQPDPTGVTLDELRETLTAALNAHGRRIVRAVDRGLEDATGHGVETLREDLDTLRDLMVEQGGQLATDGDLERLGREITAALTDAVEDLTRRGERRTAAREGEGGGTVLADANRLHAKTAEALRRVADQLERLADGRVVERQLGDLQHQIAEQTTAARSRHARLLAEVAEVRTTTRDGARPDLCAIEEALLGVEAALNKLTSTVEQTGTPG